jgi:hypothetical protein
LLLGVLIINLPVLGNLFLSTMGGVGLKGLVLPETFHRRVFDSGGWITLVLLSGLALGLLWPRKSDQAQERETMRDAPGSGLNGRNPESMAFAQSHTFTLLLILTGTFLVLFPEFFFLRDQFGYRINTIFKFYFQAWILWGLASAYAAIILLQSLKQTWGLIFRIMFAAVLVMALTYPVFGLWDKTNGFRPSAGLTLDGTAYLNQSAPDEEAAVSWLQSAPEGVEVEAVGPQYSDYARIATLSGQPAVLGCSRPPMYT